MVEFLFGYILGSSSNDSAPVSGKTVAIVFGVLMFIIGVGWMMIPVIFPNAVPEQCGGNAVSTAMCQLFHLAITLGKILAVGVALVAGIWFAISMRR